MITKRIDELTYADIEDLVQRQVPEGRVLDYKRDLPGRTDKEVKEFLADVSSFANASGGHLVFGITTKKEEGRNTNLPDKIVGVGDINVEQETLRIENLIRDNIQPRITGLRVRAVAEAGKPTLVVIHIPRSWNAPHMIGKGSPKFYTRTSAGKQPLDVTEIRHTFAMSESVGERIRAFRDERIGRILAGETPMPISPGALVVVHCIPLEAFTESVSLELKTLDAASKNLLLLPEQALLRTTNRRSNLDGVLIYSQYQAEPASSYVQVFRKGMIETIDGVIFSKTAERRRQQTILPKYLEDCLIVHCDQMMRTLQSLGVDSPTVVFLSLLNVLGFRLLTGQMSDSELSPIDRQHLLLPDLPVEDLATPAKIFLRPAFDLIWQACDGTGCPYYDKNDQRVELKVST